MNSSKEMNEMQTRNANNNKGTEAGEEYISKKKIKSKREVDTTGTSKAIDTTVNDRNRVSTDEPYHVSLSVMVINNGSAYTVPFSALVQKKLNLHNYER